MILNSHYYPDWIWKRLAHYDEESKEYVGGAFGVIEGNRFGGKSVGVGVYALEEFFKTGHKCVYTTRYKDDIEDSKVLPLESFWKKGWRFINSDKIRIPDIDDHVLTFKKHHAYIDGELFCYPASLSMSGKSKNGDYENVHKIIFDEYVAENSNELLNEVESIYRLYDTIARGREDALQTTSMIFISNCITKASSLKHDLGIDLLCREDTKRLDRSEEFGWCYEKVYNEAVTEKYNQSPIAKAQRCGDIGRAYAGYAQNNEFKDNDSFIDKKAPSGKGLYLYNVTYNNKVYSFKYYERAGFVYMSSKDVDTSHPFNYAMTREDHTVDTSLILTPEVKQRLDQLKAHFSAGSLHFDNLKTKQVFMDIYKYL